MSCHPVNHTDLTRRTFLQRSLAAGGGVLFPLIVPGRVLGRDGGVAPSNRIVMAGFGIGGRGRSDLEVMLHEPEVQFVAIADARADRRQAVKDIIDRRNGDTGCAMYRDFRDLLARRDVDALLIATGDRWHSLASILTAKAGKDMYCEKPCSTNIADSIALAETMRRYSRVYQAGTQRRNVSNFMFAIELARSGKLGKLQAVHANTLAPATRLDWLPPEPEPSKDVCDWDMWLGPCPWRPYNSQYVNGRWRGHFDFHGGGILEWGSHTVDLCQWANNADHTAPVEYEPNAEGCVARYANGVKLVMRDKGWLGLGTCSVRFEGDEGWVETGDRGEFRVFPESLRGERTIKAGPGTHPGTHLRDFLDCVKSRAQPAANGDVACQSHIACHAAYIAWQLGRKLAYDPVKNEFIRDEEANRMRARAKREPWRI
ncbi:MAG: Gfo/Idh/MocA family oxidoreductase [Verrucomicrobia bacterium]|nr:Gfo/Idh/MocA family oxidoreductase [Verrucomicrobiota bacterium]